MDHDVLSMLVKLGAPPETYPRLRSLALDPTMASHINAQAARALALSSQDRELDQAFAAEMQAALDAGDFPRLARVAAIGLARKDPEAMTWAKRALEQGAWADQSDPAVVEALAACAQELRDAGALPDGWELSALGQPETCAFTIAAGWCRREATPEAQEALRAALGSPARRGAAAAEAAESLIYADAMSPRSRRLPGICKNAPLAARADLMKLVLYHKVPLGPFWGPFEELLVSADRDVTSRIEIQVSGLGRRRSYKKRLLEVLPRIVDERLKSTLESDLGVPAEAETYWQDSSST